MQRHPGRRDPWPIVGLAAAGTFVVLLALVLATGDLAFDEPVTRFVQGLGLPIDVWTGITSLGGGAVLFPVGLALGLAALATGRLRLTLVVAVVLLGGVLFTEATKVAVARPRPPWDHLVAVRGLSFPSGHTLNSAATYGLLAVVVWRTSRFPLIVRRLAVIAGLVLPFAVGVSRVALGVHYPSDVLGGWSGGLAFVAGGAVLIGVLRAMERPRLGVRATRP
jgi:undecaprenyl-diphosphatase